MQIPTAYNYTHTTHIYSTHVYSTHIYSTHIYTQTYYTHTYIHTYIHTYLPTYIHTYVHTYIHTYIHTYLHTYIPTYLHTYIYPQWQLCIHTSHNRCSNFHCRPPPRAEHVGDGCTLSAVMSSVQKAKQKASKPLDAAEISRNFLIFELNTRVSRWLGNDFASTWFGYVWI